MLLIGLRWCGRRRRGILFNGFLNLIVDTLLVDSLIVFLVIKYLLIRLVLFFLFFDAFRYLTIWRLLLFCKSGRHLLFLYYRWLLLLLIYSFLLYHRLFLRRRRWHRYLFHLRRLLLFDFLCLGRLHFYLLCLWLFILALLIFLCFLFLLLCVWNNLICGGVLWLRSLLLLLLFLSK